MARYRGPVEKSKEDLKQTLVLKGERRLSGKSALEKNHLFLDNMDKEELRFLSMDYN